MKNPNDVTVPIIDAINIASLGCGCINDMGSIFDAIRHLSDKPQIVKGLAKIGSYLAEDWSALIDCDHERLVKLQKESV